MLSKLSAIVVAFFLSVSFYGPVVIALHVVPFNFAVFAAAAAVLIVHIGIVRYGGIPAFWLYLHIALMLLATAASGGAIRFDLLGLLLFLPVSFLLGLWVNKAGRIDTVMISLSAIYIPIACYVVYQLSLNGFSYNTYMNWSNARFKVGYLDFSLVGVMLFIYYATRQNGAWIRNVFTGAVLLTVLISGARYSIVFAIMFLCYVVISSRRKRGLPYATTLPVMGLLGSLALLGWIRPESIDKIFDYSVFRLTSALGGDRSIMGRLDLIELSLNSSAKEVFLGFGAGGSLEILGGTYPHNLLLEALLDGGLFSVAALTLFIGSCFFLSYRHVPKEQRWVLFLALFLLGAFLKSFSLYHARTLFFALGYLVAFRIRPPITSKARKLNGVTAA